MISRLCLHPSLVGLACYLTVVTVNHASCRLIPDIRHVIVCDAESQLAKFSVKVLQTVTDSP